MHKTPEETFQRLPDEDPDRQESRIEATMRESLREGLREEAAPLSRRLAEVKGLQNNTVGRLARLETTIESERNARIDDLELLVELLTEGWRSLNSRLDRIEYLLAMTIEPSVIAGASSNGTASSNSSPAELYRLPTADAR
jgi:hypothetical protein